MPKRSPFTVLCGQLAMMSRPSRADLHIHTTASDGEYTPSQVVALGREAGLTAIAITDHDTLAAVEEAQKAAVGTIEIVPGVEISAEYRGREVHLLGYFVALDHPALNARLSQVCESRKERFRDFVSVLERSGSPLPADRVKLMEQSSASLGRRHIAALLASCGLARTRVEAFHRFVGPLSNRVCAKSLVPIEEAIQLIHASGGVASLAHPSPHLADEDYRTLASLGLGAIEVDYPWGHNSPVEKLRAVAERFGFVRTGGSDCHGANPAHRRIGSRGISREELDRLRKLCGSGNAAK